MFTATCCYDLDSLVVISFIAFQIGQSPILCITTVMSLTFWKPGTAGPGSNLDRASQVEESIVPYAPQDGYLSVRGQQERLPIFKHRQYFI